MAFFGNVQCRERGQAGVIGRVGCVGTGADLRIDVFCELRNRVRIAAAQVERKVERLLENLDPHAPADLRCCEKKSRASRGKPAPKGSHLLLLTKIL